MSKFELRWPVERIISRARAVQGKPNPLLDTIQCLGDIVTATPRIEPSQLTFLLEIHVRMFDRFCHRKEREVVSAVMAAASKVHVHAWSQLVVDFISNHVSGREELWQLVRSNYPSWDASWCRYCEKSHIICNNAGRIIHTRNGQRVWDLSHPIPRVHPWEPV